jgi:hypothetical protein
MMNTMNVKQQVDIREGVDRVYRAWAEVHLSLLEMWNEHQWNFYNKHKDNYFTNPWKWVTIATGKTEKEAQDNAENIISGYRD